MTTEKTKGVATSLLIHGVLGAGLILFSGVNALTDTNPQDGTFMVELVGTGEGTPGIPGQKPGLADGTLQGDPAKNGQPQNLFKPSTQSSNALDRLEQQVREAERRAAEERRQAEVEAKKAAQENKKDTPTPPARQPETRPAAAEKTSLDDFIKSQGKQTGGTRTQNNNTRPAGGSRSGTAIKGASINAGAAIGGPGGGFGIPGGLGGNGGGGGRSSAQDLYKNRILSVLNQHWQVLLNSDGGVLDATTKGSFRLTISQNGNLSFGGWVNDPRNSLFEGLLRRAIDATGNCGPRPAGFPATLILPVSANAI